MKFSKRTAFFLGSMIIISFLFSNIFSTSNLDPKLIFIEKYFDIGDKINNLIWFVQITDIHISIFRDPSRITQFKDFCLHTIDAIKPITVLASGDLTDAKTKDQVGSTQIEKEWQYYRDILRETQIENKTLWLDIRGNHDSFNVVGHLSKNNFFTNYSIQGKLFPRSYMYQIKKDNATYTFVAIDACLDPGPKRPFNFVGILDKQEIDHIDEMLKALKSSSNYTIWFGHFPTSCILTYGEESVRDIIGKDRNGLVYLCGHLHKMGGLVPSMYTLQNAGFLELELGDWKDNRMYRILAIDHGIFSFIDVEMDEWPVVLITNPKNALFINPQRENLDSIRTSRFIRILAFSLSDITSVKLKVNKENWLHCRHVSGPLYVVPWNPQLYFEGLHDIQVFVKDKEGRTRIINQQFSLDGTQLTFNMMPKILLSSNANVMFRMMFTIMVIISIGPLLFVRYLNDLIKVGRVSKLKHNQSIWKLWIRKLCLLSTIDRIFWPLVLYPIYLCFGPWSIGYIIEEHIGVIFAWGIYIRGSFLPGSFTYVYGFIQLLTFQVPLILILAHGVDQRFQYNILKPGRKRSMLNMVCAQLPFLILIFVQLEMAYFFWLAYGTLAFLLGPLRTWSVFVALALWHQTLTFPISYVGRATAIWCPKPAEDDPQTPKI